MLFNRLSYSVLCRLVPQKQSLSLHTVLRAVLFGHSCFGLKECSCSRSFYMSKCMSVYVASSCAGSISKGRTFTCLMISHYVPPCYSVQTEDLSAVEPDSLSLANQNNK